MSATSPPVRCDNRCLAEGNAKHSSSSRLRLIYFSRLVISRSIHTQRLVIRIRNRLLTQHVLRGKWPVTHCSRQERHRTAFALKGGIWRKRGTSACVRCMQRCMRAMHATLNHREILRKKQKTMTY